MPGVQSFIDGSVEVVPAVNNDLCIGCGECIDICPGEALIMEGALPRVNRDKCIKCYCCQELCPQKGIQLKAQ
ncbi:MAG: 4Fe-4S binding protein [Deltaproteobacteria bacterium]|jgi:Fe-S-cluster-containing hydrogenase component 2|nr:4Fe-4S binding protein [Deltaproteobacteria bacterium]